MPSVSLKNLTLLALILAFIVLTLGAYTRLSNAGLGCPDWPGCYGKLVLPNTAPDLNLIQAKYPSSQLELHKAWTEMVHRYAAGTLAFLIFFLGIASFKRNIASKFISSLLMLLVIFQALLGMWTVTLKLLPIVVMGHLLGGMLIFALLCCLYLSFYPSLFVKTHWILKIFIGGGLLLIFCQIALGGWVSANYAGLACMGFPKCSGTWLPHFHFSQGFNILAPLGPNYQGGVLESSARVTIQMMHRLGALISFSFISVLAIYLYWSSFALRKKLSLILLVLLCLQVGLGIINVKYLLPLPIAIAHTGVAALILGLTLSIFHLSKRLE